MEKNIKREETKTYHELDLRQIIKYNINVTHTIGYFFPDFKSTSLRKKLYFLYVGFFVGCTFILSLLSQIIYMLKAFGDLEKMTEASFLLFTNFVQCFKMYSFMSYSPQIWRLINTMNEEIFKPRSLVQYNIVVSEIKMSKKITILFLVACTVTCFFWGISPFFDKTGLRLPLSGWYPFDTKQSPAFEIAYLYQLLTTWICGLGDLSMDTFMSGTIMFISAQLSVLNNALENMTQESDDKIANYELIRCAIHYKKIIEFAKETTYLFSFGITGQFIVGVVIICISMFQVSLVSITSFQFVGMILYLMCMFMEIYVVCFYGNEVILKSKQLTQSSYMCNWIETSKEFKQNLIIFQTRTQFPLNLYASGYFTLSLETFKAIAKSSWSYFIVLKQVHDREKE